MVKSALGAIALLSAAALALAAALAVAAPSPPQTTSQLIQRLADASERLAALASGTDYDRLILPAVLLARGEGEKGAVSLFAALHYADTAFFLIRSELDAIDAALDDLGRGEVETWPPEAVLAYRRAEERFRSIDRNHVREVTRYAERGSAEQGVFQPLFRQVADSGWTTLKRWDEVAAKTWPSPPQAAAAAEGPQEERAGGGIDVELVEIAAHLVAAPVRLLALIPAAGFALKPSQPERFWLALGIVILTSLLRDAAIDAARAADALMARNYEGLAWGLIGGVLALALALARAAARSPVAAVAAAAFLDSWRDTVDALRKLRTRMVPGNRREGG
jgi:hypothetical protein